MITTERARYLPYRLKPGRCLKSALVSLAKETGSQAVFVLSGLGSLDSALIRMAGSQLATEIEGPLEILSLNGSLTRNGAHLHLSVSDKDGRVYGGHLCPGSAIRTTCELLLIALDGVSLSRRFDPATGYDELEIAPD